MTQMFSNIRLIDYFAVIEMDIQSLIDRSESLTNSNFINHEFVIPRCSHQLVNFFPKKLYKDCYDTIFNSFNHIINDLTKSLPYEEFYITKQETKFFSLLYTEAAGKYYYGHYLRVYEEYKINQVVYKILPKEFKGKKIYGPKYLCFLSWNPFFISFKNILEEIYSLSNENSNELIKIENILNFLLFRVLLPKYEDTQISFCLNKRIYNFNSNMLYSELSFKILFQLISIENIVKIVIAYLMHSWIILIHSNIEIISPIIYAFLSLFIPFPPSYSIVVNLDYKMVDVLGCPFYLIVGVYKENFPDYDYIIKKKLINNKNASYAIYDLDTKEIKFLNIDINFSQTKDIEDKIIKKLKKYSNLYDPSILTKKLDIWKEDQNLLLNINEKIENQPQSIISRGKSIINSNVLKRFDELKIRSIFLELIATLFKAFDETKHYKTVNMLNIEAFIEDSKENLREFLKIFTNTPIWDIFSQNIAYIITLKNNEIYKSATINLENLADTKNTNDKAAAVLNRCDRLYEIFVKAIEKKKAKRSLKSLFKVKITHTISLPQIDVEHINYSQSCIFENEMNEIKFTHCSSISLFKNCLKIPFAIMKEKTYSIGNFISKESLSNFTVLNDKSLCEDYYNYYKKYYDIFLMYFGFNNKLLNNNQNSSKIINSINSESLKLHKVLENKDNYVETVQKIVGACKNFPQKMIDEAVIISTNKNYTNEFNINIGVNIHDTVSLCEFCKTPNGLWEIRKSKFYIKEDIRFEKKSEKKSKVICKNCNKPFVALFIVIDSLNDEYDLIVNKPNDSFESLMTDKSIIERNEIKEKKEKKYNNFKKIEYMGSEHMYDYISSLKTLINEQIEERENEKSNPKSKKEKEKFTFPDNKQLRKQHLSLYYNLLLLFGDLKIISENNSEKLETLNIDEYINFLEQKNKSYENKWKTSTEIEKKSKNIVKSQKNIKGKLENSKKEKDKKLLFKCELKNFIKKDSYDKFVQNDLKKQILLHSSSLNKSIFKDFRQMNYKTNDTISEIYQTKKSDTINSFNLSLLNKMNSLGPEKSYYYKLAAEDENKDIILLGSNTLNNTIEFNPTNRGNIGLNRNNTVTDTTSSYTKKKSNSEISQIENNALSKNSTYKQMFFSKRLNYK